MHGLMGESDRLDMGLPPQKPAFIRPQPPPPPAGQQYESESLSPPPRAAVGARQDAHAPPGAGPSRADAAMGMMGDATVGAQAMPYQPPPVKAVSDTPEYMAPPAIQAPWTPYPQPGMRQPQYQPQGPAVVGEAVGPAAHGRQRMGGESYEKPRERDMDWEIDNRDLEFGKLLGSGTFGDVYKGKWLGSDVAIKVLRVTRALDETQVPACVNALHPCSVAILCSLAVPSVWCCIRLSSRRSSGLRSTHQHVYDSAWRQRCLSYHVLCSDQGVPGGGGYHVVYETCECRTVRRCLHQGMVVLVLPMLMLNSCV